MKVFNLTDKDIDYRGHLLKAYGSREYPDLSFIPNRDMTLQDAKVLSFGSLPVGWAPPAPKPEPETPRVIAVKEADLVPQKEDVKVEVKEVAEVSVKEAPPSPPRPTENFQGKKFRK